MFARFDENPAMTLQDIKKTKHYRRKDARTDALTHTRTHGQHENSIPTTNKVCGGYKNIYSSPMMLLCMPVMALNMPKFVIYQLLLIFISRHVPLSGHDEDALFRMMSLMALI